MARTTLASVRAILGSEIEVADQDLANFINTASAYLDSELADAGHGTELLTAIETYVAAHFVILADLPQGVTQSKIDDDEERFSQADGLQSTGFGRLAITLDTSGTLGRVGQPVERFTVL